MQCGGITVTAILPSRQAALAQLNVNGIVRLDSKYGIRVQDNGNGRQEYKAIVNKTWLTTRIREKNGVRET